MDKAISTPNFTCAVIAQSVSDVRRMFRIAKTAFDRLPPEVKPHTKYDNVNELYFDHQNSSFYVATEIRGDTVNDLHFAEAAHTINFEQKLAASSESVPLGGMICMESTANGMGEPFQRLFSASEQGDTAWKPFFYGWNMGEHNRIPFNGQEPTEEEQMLVQEFQLDNEQLSWMRWKRKEMKNEKLFKQEHPIRPEEAFISTGGNRFDLDILKEISATLPDPIPRQQLVQHEVFRSWPYAEHLSVWDTPKPGKKYVMGTDCAQGSQSGDWSVTCVIDPESGKQVAELRGQIPVERFTDLSIALGKAYNTALWAIEADMGYGHTAIMRAKETYSNLFRRNANDGASVSERKIKKYGWSTNGRTKPAMITGLNEAFNERLLQVGSKVLINECMTYKEDEDGGMNAASGCHDDTVIAAAIAWEMRKHIRTRRRLRQKPGWV